MSIRKSFSFLKKATKKKIDEKKFDIIKISLKINHLI